MSRWNAFWKLSGADRQMLLFMSTGVIIIAASLRMFGFKAVLSVIRLFESSSDIQQTDIADYTKRLKRLTRIIKFKGIFCGNCLSRSLMILGLMRRKGICCDLVIGSRLRNGELEAHAWVEHNGQPLNASPRVRGNYTAFEQSPTDAHLSTSLTN